MKWILRFLLLFAAIAAIVWIVGMTLPQNHTVSRSARFAASPDSIWSTIVDVESYPEWRPGVDRVVRLNPSNGRLAWREITGGDRLSFEAQTQEAPARLVTRITDTDIPFGGTWEYSIVADGDGSRLTITENGEVYNPLFRFMSRYVLGHTATIDRYLEDLRKRTGEQESRKE